MKHILMVDDVATNLKCAAEVLQDKYRITMARSGVKALELLKDETPDLILLDVNMPQMDGFAVYEWIRSKKEFAHIPVIFLTAETNKEKEIKGREMGAADFIHKPYEPEELCDSVEKVLLQSAGKEDSSLNTSSLYGEEGLEKVKQAALKQETGYFVLLIFDKYRQIKEILGNAGSEELINKAVAVLEEDIGAENSICCPEGGKFTIFLKGSFEKEQIRNIVRRMIAGVEFEINEAYQELGLKISVYAGIARKPEDGISYEELYQCADKALYFVKQNGKKSYYFYHTEQNESKDTEEEKLPGYVQHLQRLLESNAEGLDVAQLFEKAYQMIRRYLESRNQKAQAVWFKMKDINEDEKQKVAEMLDEVIGGSLRKGDVGLPWGNGNYLVVLLNASREDGGRVCERIKSKWQSRFGQAETELTYEIKSI